MATITPKSSLGSLFGGKIASINYNFQTSSSASSSTITVISENNQFITPVFGEQINLPPFGIPMVVVERLKNKGTEYTTLQVELVESISKIIDKELVLIYGIHTDLNYELNNDLYYVNNSVFIPKSLYPVNSQFNESIKFPNLRSNYISNKGDGINVIGTARATYIKNSTENLTGEANLKRDPYWITFEAGQIKESVSSYDGEFVYSPEIAGAITVIYGYTLKNLYLLIQSKGISFDPESVSIMQDENIFFSESGTLRDVLTSCLSKLGRSFYVDPFSQQIKIITNADISRINTNLVDRFSSFTSVSGATQISLKESIADIEATHFVVKGDLEYPNSNAGDSDKKQPRSRKQVLYKLDNEALTQDLKKADIDLIKRVAPLVFTIDETETLDKYLFALGIQYKTENWGDLYGINQYRAGDFEKKAEGDEDNPAWQFSILNDLAGDSFSDAFYDLSRTIGARPLYSGELGTVQAVTASEFGYFQNVKDFIQLWSGTYFSAPMSEKQVNSRQYQERAKWMLGLDNSFDFEIVKGDSYIGEVAALQFLFRLLKRIGAKTTYKVSDIAKRAYKEAIGDGDYFLIGVRRMFYGSQIDSDESNRLINESFWYYSDPSIKRSFILYTKEAQDVILKIEKACLKSFDDEADKVKSKLVVRYVAVDPDEDPNEDSSQEELRDNAQLFFLRNIKSNVSNFGKRSLTMIQNRYSEIKLFLENIGSLNPQFSGPFISTSVQYFRPPVRSDFDIENGVESVSVSMSDSGVTTSVNYSSKKFAQVDLSILRDLFGASRNFTKQLFRQSFKKNRD